MLLVIDNYDSFVFNLARYFQQLDQPTEVIRNDAIDVAAVRKMAPAAIVLSPGPCTPQQAGCSLALVRELHQEMPILGVCLGHQTICAALGAQVICSGAPMHGRSSDVFHAGHPLFAGIPSPFRAGRYHSLIVPEESLPRELDSIARTADGTVMAVAHQRWPVIGVQFHPESILTEGGYQLLSNFLRLAGLAGPRSLPDLERVDPTHAELVMPETAHPPTF